MAAEITPGMKRLLEGKNFANFATLMRDGSPQVTPVWVDYDGQHILINTAKARIKGKNAARDPRVALSITEDGAVEHIKKLAKKYRGVEQYRLQPGEERVIIRIEPIRARGPQNSPAAGSSRGAYTKGGDCSRPLSRPIVTVIAAWCLPHLAGPSSLGYIPVSKRAPRRTAGQRQEAACSLPPILPPWALDDPVGVRRGRWAVVQRSWTHIGPKPLRGAAWRPPSPPAMGSSGPSLPRGTSLRFRPAYTS